MRKNYIDSPPPTLSGELHIGHARNYIIADSIARSELQDACILHGVDDNGVPAHDIRTQTPKLEGVYKDSYAKLLEELQCSVFTDREREVFIYETKSNTKLNRIADALFSFLERQEIIFTQEEVIKYSERLKRGLVLSDDDGEEFVDVEAKMSYIDFNKVDAESLFQYITRYITHKIVPESLREQTNCILKKTIEHFKGEGKWCVTRFANREVVLNTWFVSALTCKLSLDECSQSDVCRVQGTDIVPTWLFFTALLDFLYLPCSSTKLKDSGVNFDIRLTGMVTAEDGSKMSKSKGNGITLESVLSKLRSKSDYIEGIRYWASLNEPRLDVRFNLKEVEDGMKLANKLRNACKFVKLQLKCCEDIELSDVRMLLEPVCYVQCVRTMEKMFREDFCGGEIEQFKGFLKEGNISAGNVFELVMAMAKWLEVFSPIFPVLCEELQNKLFTCSN